MPATPMSTEGFWGTTDVFYSSRAFLNLTHCRPKEISNSGRDGRRTNDYRPEAPNLSWPSSHHTASSPERRI